MKYRNYEKKSLVTLVIIFLIIFELSTLTILYTHKVYKYKNITGIIIKENLVLLMVNKEERNIIYSNKKLYLNDRNTNYIIEEDRGIVLKKNKINYYELLLKINGKNKYKTNDSVNLVFKNKKSRLIDMFKIIWESD